MRKQRISMMAFDLDGTLIDSSDDIVLAVNHTLQQYGFPDADVEEIRSMVGTGISPLFHSLQQSSGISQADLHATFGKFYKLNLTSHTKLFPGVVATLEALHAIPKVIITNKQKHFVEPIVDLMGLRPYFIEVYSRESFERFKPDPLPLLNVCKKLGIEPRSTLMIGDTVVDILTGKAAGSLTAGVTYGYGSVQDLIALKPDIMLSAMGELLDIFLSFNT